ncbi:MAG: glycerate kinase [Micrococcales bacterium]|nr:glycerate kinase [Micrococcales bacterium]
MRVLICPESFTGTLTAVQAAEAMAAGWQRGAPHDSLTLAPLSAGGSGFLHVLETAQGGVTVATTVSDPLGRSVPASVLLVDEGPSRTAYIESAQAAGLHLLAADERRPLLTSSYGVGQLIDVALAEGADRIIVGLGATATNDGGAGLLGALCAGDQSALCGGGGGLADLRAESLAGLAAVVDRLARVELVAATDESLPLLGLKGTSAVEAPRKGADPVQAQTLEGCLGHFTDVVAKVRPPRLDLLTGLPRRPEREPGAGAGGGMGYALFLLGATRDSAVEIVQRAWDFDGLLHSHDLIITGEGRFDRESLRESVAAGTVRAAARLGRPAVVLAGQVQVGRRETMAAGVAGAYAVAERPVDVASAMADPVGTLATRAERLARTWSPPPDRGR